MKGRANMRRVNTSKEFAVAFRSRDRGSRNYKNNFMIVSVESLSVAVDVAKNEFRKTNLSAKITGVYELVDQVCVKVMAEEKEYTTYSKRNFMNYGYTPYVFIGRTFTPCRVA